jgi:3-oxoadipate enol-lactonase
MTIAHTDGVDLHYETAGDGPTLAFVGDVGFGAWQWAWQVDALAGPFEVLVYDYRGTGRSDAPEGPYDVATLVSDLEAVLSAAGVENAHLVGLGLGGIVALEYARDHARAERLTLLGTAADADGVDPMALYAPRDDPDALRETTERALSGDFVEQFPEAVEDVATWRADDDADRDGWAAQGAAVEGYEGDDLYEITTPTLVVHGTRDGVWPPDRGRTLADALPRGEFEAVDGAGHLVQIEASEAINDLLFASAEEKGAL